MTRMGEDIIGRTLFNDATCIHDGNTVGGARNYVQRLVEPLQDREEFLNLLQRLK